MRKENHYRFAMIMRWILSMRIKLNILIEREVIRRNGPYIEMDEHYLSFYELLLGGE